jgi:hypothetical protein
MLDDAEWKRVSSLFNTGTEGDSRQRCLPLLYASTNASPAFMKRIQMFCMTIAYLSGGHRERRYFANNPAVLKLR